SAPIRQRVEHRLGRPDRTPLCAGVKVEVPDALPERGLRLAGRPGPVGSSFPAAGHYRLAVCRVQGALRGAAERPGFARSVTRPPGRSLGMAAERERGQERGLWLWS